MRKIKAYSIENIGADHPQYFQGVGVSGTEWDDVALGAGNDAKEAYEDACDILAQEDWDADRLPKHPRGIRKTDTIPPCDECGSGETCEHDDNEIVYYVAIYVRSEG